MFLASSAKKKCRTEHGLVALVKISEGKVVIGEQVRLVIDGNIVTDDTISFIEKDHQPVQYAELGEEIGLCLKQSNLKNIQKALANLP